MALKIAYIAFLPRPSIGVEKTLLEKTRAFASLNANVDVFLVYGGPDKQNRGVNFVGPKLYLPRFALYLCTVFFRYWLIAKSVDLDAYDITILRYPAADPSGPGFTKRFRVVTEHHSCMLAEMESYTGSGISLPVRIMKRLRVGLERTYGTRTLRRCRGLIGVTDEIRIAERGRAGSSLPSITVPNGIDVSSISATGFAPFNGKELNIVFLASSLRHWQGLDRLTTGLRQYKGNIRIGLHLIGDIPINDVSLIDTKTVSVVFHGTLRGNHLNDVLGEMTLAVSTLGLHRKKLQEGSVLKTREYTARGLPFIIGYRDPDLYRVPDGHRFFLPVAADDSAIDIPQVIEFARGVSSNAPAISEFMRSYAFEHMDWRPKMQKYVEFCEGIIADD